MATLEIVFRAGAGSPRTFTVGNDTGGTMRIGAIGSGGAGGSGTVFVGGGGKGGSYAERTNQAVSSGDVLTLSIASGVATGNGSVSTVTRSGVTLVSARGGGAGANAGTLNAGAGGTAFVGTFVGDIERTGGNGINGGAGGGGAGTLENGGIPSGTTAAGLGGQKYGGDGADNDAPAMVGGGGGKGVSTISSGNRPSASGLVVLSYSTGVGSISHTSQFNRLATLSRLGLASITHTSIFDRLVTIRRNFTATITHLNRTLKTIKLSRLASIVHLSGQTRKKVRLTRTVEINHDPFVTKDIVLAPKVATIVHTARFQRLVTLRRRFTATIRHRARQLMKLEGRLIPREGGGGVINNIRNFFIFDE